MGSPSQDELYDLAPTVSEAKPAARPVSLAYQPPATVAPTAADPETIKNLHMPIGLLAGGILIETIAALLRERDWRVGLVVVGIQVILGTAILLVGVLLAARFRGIALGTLPLAAMKLAAIAIAPAALATLFSPFLDRIPVFGGLIAWLLSFVLYFALLGVFFDLDESDTWYCVWVIFLVRLGLYFALIFGVIPLLR